MARVVWQPQPGPQTALVNCPVDEIAYGGARGGGKTDGMLGKNALKAEIYGQHQSGIFFRRKQVELEEAIQRAHEIYQPLGWHWQDQKRTYNSPNGARLKFRYLERDSDAMLYQGHNYTDIYIEEAGAFPRPDPINKLRATLRSGHGVPCQLHLTFNPGGPGHQWLKARYIDPHPDGMRVFLEKMPSLKKGEFVENRYVFIPAKLKDNNYLGDDYVARLRMSGSEALVRAWLEGDWNIVEGAFFDCWSDRMVIKPFTPPEHWTKIVGFDWGSAAPFCVQWWCVASEDYIHYGERIPKGALICYREWYGAKGPNIGLKMTAEAVGQGIKERTKERVNFYVADPAIFNEDGGPSIMERMRIPFHRAENKRTSTESKMGGWDMMRMRMEGQDGVPMIYFMDTCKDSIRTIPVLQHDEIRPEDLDTDGEDHAADTTRYVCMSRPWMSKRAKTANMDVWERRFRESELSYYDGDTWRTL